MSDEHVMHSWENEGGATLPDSPMDFKATQTEAKPEPNHMDQVSAMMAWENGNISEGEAIHLFQHLVDTGLAWTLQGSYGRQAVRFINAGLIKPRRVSAISTAYHKAES